MNQTEPTRTDAQNRALWGCVARLRKEQGLSAEDAQAVLRGHVKAVSGQESTKTITVNQAAAVLRRLERVTPNPKAPQPAAKPVPAPARASELGKGPDPEAAVTPAQLEYLGQITEMVGLDSRGYRGFCQRMLKHPWPQTRGEAIKVTEGMESMLRRKYTKSALAQYALTVKAVPHISTEDRAFCASIVEAAEQSRPLSAGQITICLRIGARYGVAPQSVVGELHGSSDASAGEPLDHSAAG